jgi:hypothetical protein
VKELGAILGDSISAERTSSSKVSILTLSVHERNQGQGSGRALVECLISNLPTDVKTLAIKAANDAPGFWEKMKRFTGGRIIDVQITRMNRRIMLLVCTKFDYQLKAGRISP